MNKAEVLAELAELKQQIAGLRRAVEAAGYDASRARARIVCLAREYGGPVLDVGTGACACMAVALARRGLRVTAIDRAPGAVRVAEERAAGALADRLEVRNADAARMPFADGAYRVAVAFDALCHASDPARMLAEMFRVCAHGGVIIVAELNAAGRRVTRHHDDGFEQKLPGLLAEHCRGCRPFVDAYHVTFVCEKKREATGPKLRARTDARRAG